MNSFIERHLARFKKTAPKKPKKVCEENHSTEYSLLVTQCRHDDNHLRAQYPEHHIRNRHKKAILAKYRTQIDEYLSQPPRQENEVLGWALIWAADTKDWDLLLKLATHCSGSSITLPRSIKRSPTVFAADTLFQYVEPLIKYNNEGQIDAKNLFQTAFEEYVDTNQWELNHPLKARFYKLMGKLSEFEKDINQALSHYKRAFEIYPKSGVKDKIKELSKHPNNNKETPTPPTGGTLATSSSPQQPASSEPKANKAKSTGECGDAVLLDHGVCDHE